MALKVPTYDRQVEEKAGQTPLVPNVSPPPPGAFGTGIAQEMDQGGRVVGGLGDILAQHMLEREKHDALNQVFNADTQARKEVQDLLLNQDLGDDNKPKGILNRLEKDASGSTIDFDQKAAELKNRYVGQFQNKYQQDEIAKSLDSHLTNARETVIEHEVTQDREHKIGVLNANVKQQIDDSAIIQDPTKLITAIKNIHENQYKALRPLGLDDTQIVEKQDEVTNKIVESAVMHRLQTDPAGAQTLFNTVKNSMAPKDADDLQKNIMIQTRLMDNLHKEQLEMKYDTNLRKTMLDALNSNLTPTELQRRYRADDIKLSDYKSLESRLLNPLEEFTKSDHFSDPEVFNNVRNEIINRQLTQGGIDRLINQGVADGKLVKEDEDYLIKQNNASPKTPKDDAVQATEQSIREFANNYYGDDFNHSILGIPIKKEETKIEKNKAVEEVVKKLYKATDGKDVTADQVPIIGKQILTDFLTRRFPEMKTMDDFPHAVIDTDNKITRLLNPNQPTKIKPAFTITRNKKNQ